jgi:hypothetical protein
VDLGRPRRAPARRGEGEGVVGTAAAIAAGAGGWLAAALIMAGMCRDAARGDRALELETRLARLEALEADTIAFEPVEPEPTPAQRALAWADDDPAELRRAAREWRRIGATDYAAALEAQAAGEEHPIVARPW